MPPDCIRQKSHGGQAIKRAALCSGGEVSGRRRCLSPAVHADVSREGAVGKGQMEKDTEEKRSKKENAWGQYNTGGLQVLCWGVSCYLGASRWIGWRAKPQQGQGESVDHQQGERQTEVWARDSIPREVRTH